MSERLRSFWSRHPILREVMIWAIPALIVGAILRGLMLSYLPYAYWGSDSRSYFSFAHKLLSEGYISLDEKRRFFYPIFMVPVSLLPGAPLKWLAWIQHGFGLLTLLPLAYAVRKSFVHWRWWIVPVTVLYAGLPVILWYEHELLGETMMFAGVVWAFAGWCAWVSEERRARAEQLFWWFFVPFTLVILTKPSARFFWPGLLLGLLAVQCGAVVCTDEIVEVLWGSAPQKSAGNLVHLYVSRIRRLLEEPGGGRTGYRVLVRAGGEPIDWALPA